MTIQEIYNELLKYRKAQPIDIITEKKRKSWEYFRMKASVINLEKNLKDNVSLYYAPVRQTRGSSLVCWPFPDRTEIYVDENFALSDPQLAQFQLTHELLHSLSEKRDGKQLIFGYSYSNLGSVYTGINEACTQLFAEDIEEARLNETEDYLYFVKNIMRVMKVVVGERKLADQFLGNNFSFEDAFNKLTENKFNDFVSAINDIYNFDKKKKAHSDTITKSDEEWYLIRKKQILDFTKKLIERTASYDSQLIPLIQEELRDENFARQLGLSVFDSTKEQSYIKMFSIEMLTKYGLSFKDRETIGSLINHAIKEQLYSATSDYQHDLKHIEKVLTYTKMISNRLKTPINTNLLMCASLYHDIGKTVGASNQEHGEVGATRFEQMMKGKMSDKDIKIVSLLIKQHALESDTIIFDDDTFTEDEKKEIQLMSDILKDADALDRNRLNYPAPIGTCDIHLLRTAEAKEVYSLSDSFYQDYCRMMICSKEQKAGTQILDNYELLEQWITAYENGEENMFHASLNPGIEQLQPTESTQKGTYVYAGIDPVSCFMMASFRLSLLFPRTKVYKDSEKKETVRAIKEIFKGSIDDTLGSKYITIYKLPNEKFHQYVNPATAASVGEWVSEGNVRPVQQVSFKALDLLNYLKDTKRLGVVQDYSKEAQLSSFMSSFKVYIWGVKHLKDDPTALDKRWSGVQKTIQFYVKDERVLETLNKVKENVDQSIVQYVEDFRKEHGREPDYDNEHECVVPLINQFQEKYYRQGNPNELNYEVLDSLIQPLQEQGLTREAQFVHQTMVELTSDIPDDLNPEEMAITIGSKLNDRIQKGLTDTKKSTLAPLFEHISQSPPFQQSCLESAKVDVVNAMGMGCSQKDEFVETVTLLTEQRTTVQPEHKQVVAEQLAQIQQKKRDKEELQSTLNENKQLVKKNNTENTSNSGFGNALTFSLLIVAVCMIVIAIIYIFCWGIK